MWQQSRGPIGVALVAGAALSATCLVAWQNLSCRDLARIHHGFACDQAAAAVEPSAYHALEKTLHARLETAGDAGDITRAAVHFRDLRTGAGFGIDDEQLFAPASLLKLALAFVFFAEQDENPGELDKTLRYAPDQVRDFSIPKQIETAGTGLSQGSRHPISELLHAAIAQSDNLAYYVLLQYLTDLPQGRGRARFQRTLRELGIVDPPTFADEVASPRDYAALFRQLYNASYLDAESSDTLLSWLGESTYDKGIAAGVPEGIEVANKFGEREVDDGTKQLHDCGIVYHPEHPYALCVMTKGDDFGELRATVAAVSRLAYAEVDSGSALGFCLLQ